MKTIYTLTTPDGKVYVGSTKNLHTRLTLHKNSIHNTNRHEYTYAVYQHIRDTGGWQEVEVKVITRVPSKYADTVERNVIKFFRSTNPLFGLNTRHGGDKTPVMVFNAKSGEYISSYPSESIAAKALNIRRPNLVAVLTGRAQSAGGYTFKRGTKPQEQLIKFKPPTVCLGLPIASFNTEAA